MCDSDPLGMCRSPNKRGVTYAIEIVGERPPEVVALFVAEVTEVAQEDLHGGSAGGVLERFDLVLDLS